MLSEMHIFLIFINLASITATFDSSAQTRAVTVIDDVLSVADTHSTLIQDGFESRFLLNDTGIEFETLGGLLFAQIRTMTTSFYHLWAGFENAAFLGYYQYDINVEDRYSLSWQSDKNYVQNIM